MDTRKAYLKEYGIRWIETNYERNLLKISRNSAKKKDLEFNLDISDIVIPTHCPYLGCELTRVQGKGKVPTNASIDRIDPSKGYIKGNIQILSLRANRMKNDASPEELIKFAKSILKHYGTTTY